MNNKKYFLDFGSHLLEGFNQFLDLNLINSTFDCLSFEANPYIFAKCLTNKFPESRRRVSSLYLINCAISGNSPDSGFVRFINLNSCRVEGYQAINPKFNGLGGLIFNQARSIKKFIKKIFFNKENLNKQNVIDTQASNILAKPPLTDFGFTFAYDIEKVVAIDIIELLSALQNPSEIVIKMDIEGAEFAALKSLLNNITLLSFHPSILKIYIEWHERFFEDQTKYAQLRTELELGLKDAGVRIFEWI